MNTPLVSVLITSYNREKYIATAIESVLSQSMDDFELIITDNASTDQTLDIARQYESDKRIRIIANQQNIGQFPNRNLAAQVARGKYLKYVDSDDAIYPHCLEVMTYMMERHPNTGMLLCAWLENEFYPFELSSEEAYRRSFIHEKSMSNSPLTTMYQKEAFEQVGGFENEKWPLSGDWDIILKIARNFPVIFAPTGLCFYRLHETQMGVTHQDIIHNFTVEGISISLEALRHPDCPLPENEKKWAIGKLLRGAFIYAVSLGLKHKRPVDAIRFLKPFFNKSKEWINLFRFQKPVVSRPKLNAAPNWANYPRSRPLGNVKKESENIQVSVVLPVISNQGNLKATIESVLVQSLSEFELLICVRDKNQLIGQNIENCLNDPRARVLIIKDKLDELEMMNQGAKASQAEYVKFLTPGILMYPWALEYILFPLRKKNGVLAVECAAGYLIYPIDLDFENVCRENFLRGGILVMPPEAACVKRDMFLKLGGFDVAIDKAAFHDMWLRLSLEGDVLLPTTGLTTAYKGWQLPVPQAFMNGILPEQYKSSLCKWLESVRYKLDAPLFHEIMKRMNMDANQLAKVGRPERMQLCADWSFYPWTKHILNNLIL